MLDPHHILTLTTILGALGLWLMLPRGTSRGRAVGIIMASMALGLGASQMPRLGNWTADVVFWVLAGVAVVSGAAAVTFRNPLYSAIWFGLSLLGAAGLFLLLGAQFLAVATVVVYVGAILVTFLFVLMLAQPEGKAAYDRVSWESLVSAAAGMVIVGILSMTIGRTLLNPDKSLPPLTPASNAHTPLKTDVLTPHHVARFGAELFGKHLLAVELVGVLLLASLVGAAAIVGHKRSD